MNEMKISRHQAAIHKGGMRAACLAFVAALGLTLLQAGDLFFNLAQIHRENIALEKSKKQLAALQVTAAPVTEPLGRLRQAVERQHLFSVAGPTPWQALSLLNSSLGETARVAALDWQDDGNPANEALLADIRLIPAPESHDREAIIKRFQQVAENVRQAMPDYTVILNRYPFPASPDESLTNTNDTEKSLLTAQLGIRKVAR